MSTVRFAERIAIMRKALSQVGRGAAAQSGTPEQLLGILWVYADS